LEALWWVNYACSIITDALLQILAVLLCLFLSILWTKYTSKTGTTQESTGSKDVDIIEFDDVKVEIDEYNQQALPIETGIRMAHFAFLAYREQEEITSYLLTTCGGRYTLENMFTGNSTTVYIFRYKQDNSLIISYRGSSSWMKNKMVKSLFYSSSRVWTCS
jgi:hypothetical protein